ncbi:MAG: purine-nucleoside phosphorylase [Lachnospiraceae bacterium]|nr:purine-nucleoside phosphorylase [Lachnospiraceae bacterium]
MGIPTPHISAAAGDFAKTVLMPGDPLRARFIAENFLDNARLVTEVRNVLGYTGTYKGEPVSVMASGMGMPSMGIYSHELFAFYGVENIIRIGSAGSINEKVGLHDIVIAQGASTTSRYAFQFKLPGTYAPLADFGLLNNAVKTAEAQGTRVVVGNVLSDDAFYGEDPAFNEAWRSMGVLAIEMEAAALYMEAAKLGKKALAMFTISDDLLRDEHLSSKEREVGFSKMMELALGMSKD